MEPIELETPAAHPNRPFEIARGERALGDDRRSVDGLAPEVLAALDGPFSRPVLREQIAAIELERGREVRRVGPRAAGAVP